MNVVNFEVKQSGLEEQVLKIVLRVFDEKIEQQRIECINIKARCQNTLAKLEEKILQMLQSERKMLLFDDLELIGTLQSSKEQEEEVQQTISINKSTQAKNSIQRENY